MENKTENTELENFIDAYNKWLESRPKSENLDFVEFHALSILLKEEKDGLSVRNVIGGHIRNMIPKNALQMYKHIEQQVQPNAMKQIARALKEN